MSLVFRKNIVKKRIILLISFLLPMSLSANVVINGTRVIYNEGVESVNVQLANNGNLASLTQNWIDDGDIDSTPESAHSPFYVYPPIVKILAGQGQTLKIKKADENIKNNIESVYYLNILDIPENLEALQGKTYLQLVMKSRIKIFYRPKSLIGQPETIYEKINYLRNGDNITVKNNSQYHFTIASISSDNVPKTILAESEMISPLSSRELPLINKLIDNKILVTYVDDFGVFKTQHIEL